MSWYGDLANRFMETTAGKVLGSVATRIAEHAVGKAISKLAGPAGLVYEAVTGGIREDLSSGSYLSAAAKIAGLGLGAAALVAAAVGSTPLAAGLGVASLVVGLAPDVVNGVVDGLKDTGVIKPTPTTTTPANVPPAPLADTGPLSNNIPATVPSTYAAVDTTRLMANDQQPPTASVVKDPKESPVVPLPAAQQVASRPTPAVNPVV